MFCAAIEREAVVVQHLQKLKASLRPPSHCPLSANTLCPPSRCTVVHFADHALPHGRASSHCCAVPPASTRYALGRATPHPGCSTKKGVAMGCNWWQLQFLLSQFRSRSFSKKMRKFFSFGGIIRLGLAFKPIKLLLLFFYRILIGSR